MNPQQEEDDEEEEEVELQACDHQVRVVFWAIERDARCVRVA